MSDESCLILFARAPALGQVKQRLAASLGQEQALSLYRCMLARQIRLANSLDGVARRLVVAGNPQDPALADFTGSIHVQGAGDIGKRMAAALASALAEYRHVILIGCDSPGLDRDYLQQAFSALDGGNDAVFGPARDGGYVLVGLRRMQPALFAEIDWGTASVMAQTRQKLTQAGLQWHELAVQVDIDEPADLVRHAALVSRAYGERGKHW